MARAGRHRRRRTSSRKAGSLISRIETAFIEEGSPIAIGLSFGVASLRRQDTLEDMLRRADAQMYAAKRIRKSLTKPRIL